ncbi:uncharacterized protein LOC111101102 isoform X2 [Crassostrea virginica]
MKKKSYKKGMSSFLSCTIIKYIVLILLSNSHLVSCSNGLHLEDRKCHERKILTNEQEPRSDCPHGENVHQIALTKNCSKYPSCNGEPLVYHCVKHVDVGSFIEICARRVRITGKCCTEYDEILGQIREDFSRPCSNCPFHYFSNEIYKECSTKLSKEETNEPGSVTYIYFFLLLAASSGFICLSLLWLVLKRKRFGSTTQGAEEVINNHVNISLIAQDNDCEEK